MRWLLIFLGPVIILCSPAQAQKAPYYSTCPDLQHAVGRSIAYKEVPESDLLRWAMVQHYPKRSPRPEAVHVQVQIEGERVFCAQAMDGPPNKQKAAVMSAMRWRFKKNRGDFNSDVMGKLTFLF